MLSNPTENVDNAFHFITSVSKIKYLDKIKVIPHNLKKRGEFPHVVIVYLGVRQFCEHLNYLV